MNCMFVLLTYGISMIRPSKRIFTWLLIASLLSIGDAAAAAAKESEHFTVVLLPDTQKYTRSHPKTYMAQTQWIKDRIEPDNIKFVIHLGDIVDNYDSQQQWEVADSAHRILDGKVPYSMLPGNHDMGLKRDSKLYNKYFGPNRFQKNSWYGGHEGQTNNNSFSFFEAAGMKFIGT